MNLKKTIYWPLVIIALLAAAFFMIPNPVHRIFIGKNLITVIEDQIYRSAQPSASDIATWSKQLKLRSIVNLRGEGPWLKDETAVAKSEEITIYSIPVSSGHLPGMHVARKLIHILDTAPQPLLVHCLSGIDRSGLFSALAILLNGGDLEQARQQFSLSKGFIPFRDSDALLLFLSEYEDWLVENKLHHAPEHLRHWAQDIYIPYFYHASITPITFPDQVFVGRPTPLKVAVKNTSYQTIPFRTSKRGVHLGAFLHKVDSPGKSSRELRGCFIDLDLAPNEKTELDLLLPSVPEPGKYLLEIDLVDENIHWFHEMGSPMYQFEFDVLPASHHSIDPT
ncbi:MAG: tyrosine-protein phosphatase [Candidatus Scalindua sp.]|nr:tyrosine-protein phosphatase [Candidatus Scalindua sp.]